VRGVLVAIPKKTAAFEIQLVLFEVPDAVKMKALLAQHRPWLETSNTTLTSMMTGTVICFSSLGLVHMLAVQRQCLLAAEHLH